jgi:hypothetical protein
MKGVILMSNKIETTNGVKVNVEDLGGTGMPVVSFMVGQ